MPIHVDALDHLVLTVCDVAETKRFYETVLGMRAEEFQPGRWALMFGRQKLNLHVAGQVIDPNVRHATPGSADLCLLSDTPMAEILAHLAECGAAVIEGPIRRTGAAGPIELVYVYDPDENLLEIANRSAVWGFPVSRDRSAADSARSDGGPWPLDAAPLSQSYR